MALTYPGAAKHRQYIEAWRSAASPWNKGLAIASGILETAIGYARTVPDSTIAASGLATVLGLVVVILLLRQRRVPHVTPESAAVAHSASAAAISQPAPPVFPDNSSKYEQPSPAKSSDRPSARATDTQKPGVSPNPIDIHQIPSKGLGIAALALAIIGIFIPIYGLWVSGVAVLCAFFAAVGGETALVIASVVIIGVDKFFLSPSLELFYYSNPGSKPLFLTFVFICLLVPICISLYNKARA